MKELDKAYYELQKLKQKNKVELRKEEEWCKRQEKF